MSTETGEKTRSGGSGNSLWMPVSIVLAMAVLIFAFSAAHDIGGGGLAVFTICLGCGGAFGLTYTMLYRLPPAGRLALILVIAAAVLVIGASLVDLGRPGW